MAKRSGKPRPTVKEITPALIQAVRERLRQNRRVRRTLPQLGRIHVDRQLPFLCVYRRTKESADLEMRHLVTSEAAYLYTTDDRRLHGGLSGLIDAVADVMVEQFGTFLLLEIWPGLFTDEPPAEYPVATPPPRFRIVAQPAQQLGGFIDKFVESLARIQSGGQSASVDLVTRYRVAPPKLRPLMTPQEAQRRHCLTLGLELLPVFADPQTGKVFPQLRRQMERSLSVALKQTFFQFARTCTTHRPPHYHALGRRATVKAVWRADRLLAEVSDRFDFLLQVSPINGQDAWRDFKRCDYRQPPTFHYRPLPVDPVVLKRKLYETPVDRLEDPAIGQLLRDKVNELDRQINMLLDINTPRFVHGSIQLHGGVEDSLLAVAEETLRRLPTEKKTKRAELVNAQAFAAEAQQEIAFLQRQDEGVRATVQVRSDIVGLMVSQGSLLVGAETSVPRERVNALLQHEVGTHILTYYNGRSQPFRQLYAGLAGYEALQEGLAVLSEYLVGGLSRDRLRLLAARVVAVGMMLDRWGFVPCFQRLVDQYRFSPRVAFTITMRVFRGGGLAKDAVYLRGLMQSLEYLAQGGDLETLLIGKIAAEHVPLIRELRWRQVLTQPQLRPRYLNQPEALARLQRARRGLTVADLVTSSGRRSERGA